MCTLSDNHVVSALVLSLIAALGYGVSDFLGGLAARRAAVLGVVLLSYPVGCLGLLAVAPLVGGAPTAHSLLIGAVAGLVSGCAILWFYAALASGPMSVVSPLTSLLVAGVPLGVGMLWGERPGPLALVGAGMAVVAVVLVSRQENTSVDVASPVRFTPKVAWLTGGSGLAFAVYFVLLDKVDAGTGLWPLVMSRASASALVLVTALVTGRRTLPTGGPLRLALLAALLDMAANWAFLYALKAGMLSIVSVLTSLYPAATVLLARVVLKEHTGWAQRIGLILAALAVGLIAGAPATG
jgi:drug/metabolite transporter (DMT)-like permease